MTAAASRPLRSVVVVLIGWAAFRTAAWLPGEAAPPLPEAVAVGAPLPAPTTTRVIVAGANAQPAWGLRTPMYVAAEGPNAGPVATRPKLRASELVTVPVPVLGPPPKTPAPSTIGAPMQRVAASDWAITGSAWAIGRSGGATGALPLAQLGGSQAGARLYLTRQGVPLALTASATAALRDDQRELAIGVAYRRPKWGLIAERREALGANGRSAFALLGYAGIERRVSDRIRADGYAQAGVVGFRSRDLFADGALRADHALFEMASVTLAAGAGVWGAAQPGARRIDVGPQLVGRMRLKDASLRLSVDYRLRVAGDAAPDSGPAVSIGTDL